MQGFHTRFSDHAVVRAVWCRSERLALSKRSQIEPDANCDFIFCFSEEGDIVSSIFAGFDTVAQPFEATPGNFTYVGIQLQPQAAASMIGADMKDCVNRRLALSELLGSRQSRIWDALERFSRSALAGPEQLSLSHLQPLFGQVRHDSLLVTLQEALKGRPFLDTIAEIADDQGFSIRTLERRSLQSTGLTPRELIRIYRFVRARKLYRPGISFAELALAGGFADQAHMSREFRRIAGTPPSRYFQRRCRPDSRQTIFDLIQ